MSTQINKAFESQFSDNFIHLGESKDFQAGWSGSYGTGERCQTVFLR